jgi:hypothetical protein
MKESIPRPIKLEAQLLAYLGEILCLFEESVKRETKAIMASEKK